MPVSLLFLLGLAALSAAIAWAMARWRLIVDVPNARSSHVRPTPRGGGLGILIAFGAGLLFAEGGAFLRDPAFLGVALGAVIAGLAGLADDIRGLSYAMKLGGQAAAAILAIALGAVVETLDLPGLGPVSLGVFGPVLTFFWLVGLTNAYNFMDGLDGLAGGTAMLAGALLAAAALLAGAPGVAALALLLTAASAGFLVLNLPPARIFMGDVGSQFLGFAFAGLGVLLARDDATGTLILVVPLLLFHFLFDTIFTALRRTLNGENPTAAHRGHLYQLLNRAGLSHRCVALTHGALVVLQGLGALWLVGAAPQARWLAFAPFLVLQAAYAATAFGLFRRASKGTAI